MQLKTRNYRGLHRQQDVIHENMRHHARDIKQHLDAAMGDWIHSFSEEGHSQRNRVRSNMMDNIDAVIAETLALRDLLQTADYDHMDKEFLLQLLKRNPV